MAWERSFASPAGDVDDFAAFQCWSGQAGTPWIEEVENYVRVSVLSAALWTVAFRDEAGKLSAVSAFDPVPIEVPLCNPVENPGWKLQVVAVALDHQTQGRCREVYRETFAAMREADPQRLLVTANVHRQHAVSLKAAASAGLTLLMPGDEFHLVLGEVPRPSG